MSQLALSIFKFVQPLTQWLKLTFFKGTRYRIATLFLMALSVTLLLSDGNTVAEALFQSPTSPAQNSPPVAPPQPPPDESQTGRPPPPPPSQSSPSAVENPEGNPEPVFPDEPISIEGVDPVAPEEPLPPPLPQPQSPHQPATRNYVEEPEEGAQNLILDQAELIDTIVVSTAYVWLCCGIVVILFIPLIFLFLHIRGRGKITKEEQI